MTGVLLALGLCACFFFHLSDELIVGNENKSEVCISDRLAHNQRRHVQGRIELLINRKLIDCNLPVSTMLTKTILWEHVESFWEY